MTPKSTLAAAHFLMENTRLSINNVTADYPGYRKAGRWYCKWDAIRYEPFDDCVKVGHYEGTLTHANIEQLARSIGWQGEGE